MSTDLSPVLDFAGGYGTRSYDVVFDKENTIISCQCCKFKKDGIFCCHVLKVLTDNRLKKIPDQYILKRWIPAENATSLGVWPQPEQIAKLPTSCKYVAFIFENSSASISVRRAD